MNLTIGTKIRYSSAAGTRTAVIKNINIGPTAKVGFSNTWLTLEIPVQSGVKFQHIVQLPADNASLIGFKVQAI